MKLIAALKDPDMVPNPIVVDNVYDIREYPTTLYIHSTLPNNKGVGVTKLRKKDIGELKLEGFDL